MREQILRIQYIVTSVNEMIDGTGSVKVTA